MYVWGCSYIHTYVHSYSPHCIDTYIRCYSLRTQWRLNGTEWADCMLAPQPECGHCLHALRNHLEVFTLYIRMYNTYVGTNVRMYVCMRVSMTSLPCVQNYDSTESPAGGKGSWLFCFSSSFELGKFEATLAQLWQEKMLVCGWVMLKRILVLLVLVVHCCALLVVDLVPLILCLSWPYVVACATCSRLSHFLFAHTYLCTYVHTCAGTYTCFVQTYDVYMYIRMYLSMFSTLYVCIYISLPAVLTYVWYFLWYSYIHTWVLKVKDPIAMLTAVYVLSVVLINTPAVRPHLRTYVRIHSSPGPGLCSYNEQHTVASLITSV